jgi:hypothetical protein
MISHLPLVVNPKSPILIAKVFKISFGDVVVLFGINHFKESAQCKRAAFWPPFVFYLRVGRLYEHPVVDPHVSHFKHVPFRTKVKFKHSEHISPS